MPNVPAVLIGTSNKGKIREFSHGLIQALYGCVSFEFLKPEKQSMIGIEQGGSFEAHALAKARGLYASHDGKRNVLCEDSGLCVEALSGEPGIYSARYSSFPYTSKKNIENLLKKLIGSKNRRAFYVCVISLIRYDGEELSLRAQSCYGNILEAVQGEGGFGYDPVFYIPSKRLTMAELSVADKHALSHRGRIQDRLSAILPAWLSS